jgi:membrane protein implicated in regulation of membrane protease activity
VNAYYSILESRHRWLILAAIAFAAATVGAIVMLAYGWPHTLVRVWFYAGALLTVYLLVRAFLQWKESVEQEIEESQLKSPTRTKETNR